MKNGKIYLAICVLALAAPVHSLETTLGVNLGLEYSDNGTKTGGADTTSDVEQKAGLDLGLRHEGQKAQVDLDYSVERSSYDNGTQDDSTDINGQLKATFEPVKDSVFLHLESSTRNIVTDKATVDVSDNRENRTITSLKPEWSIRLSPADRLSLSVSYTDIQFEESAQNSDRSGASAKWLHQRSKVDTLSAVISYSDIGFDADLSELDYEYYQAFFSYAANLSHLEYHISVGYNETRRDSRDNASGGFVDAEFNYTSAASTWSLALGRELTDSSRGNNNTDLAQFSSFQGTNNEIENYELTTLRVSWKNTGICAVCAVDAHLSYEGEDYEISDSDNEEISAGIGFSYELTRSTKLSFDVSYSDFKPIDNVGDRKDHDRVLTRFTFIQSFSPDLSIRLFARYDDARSDDFFYNYEELVGGISLRYSFL